VTLPLLLPLLLLSLVPLLLSPSTSTMALFVGSPRQPSCTWLEVGRTVHIEYNFLASPVFGIV